MTYRANNSYDLASFLLLKNTDTRKWGLLSRFTKAPIYHKYFWDMGQKYVWGKPVLEHIMSQEYQDVQQQCLSAFIDYINDSDLEFPLTYECHCTGADGRSTWFETTYTYDNQVSFIKSYD